MRATDILREEHRWIRDLLDALAQVVEGAVETATLDPATPELLDLFETFADHSHQQKEERLLFPRLHQRARSRDSRVLRRLENDHDRDRHMMGSMQSNLLGAVYGEPLCLRQFVEQASSYVRLHQNHMRLEGDKVFVLADEILTDQDDRELCARFEHVDSAAFGGRERLHQRIEQVCLRFRETRGRTPHRTAESA